MQLNRILLRTVLALLAAAALTAVIAALTGNTTALWRVVFTCVEAAVAAGAADRDAMVLETLLAFKRAGCSGVLTYHAAHAARLMGA